MLLYKRPKLYSSQIFITKSTTYYYYYLEILRRSCENVKRKGPENWRAGE